MGVIEKDIAITYKDGEGNTILAYPVTKVENVDGAVSEVDLQSYVTNEQLESKNYITEIPAEYVTESELTSKAYITSSALVPYALTETVNSQLSTKANVSDLTNYVTNEALNSRGFITSDSLAPYATKSELDNKANTSDLEDYATKTELSNKADKSSLSSYLLITEVSNAANKVPRYNASGHLVLPNGAEFWIA